MSDDQQFKKPIRKIFSEPSQKAEASRTGLTRRQDIEPLSVPEEMKTDQTETPGENEQEQGLADDPFLWDQLQRIVARYFVVESPNDYYQAQAKLNTIVRWAAKETNSLDPEKILKKIKKLESKLPSAGYQERRYAIVHRHIVLDSQMGN